MSPRRPLAGRTPSLALLLLLTACAGAEPEPSPGATGPGTGDSAAPTSLPDTGRAETGRTDSADTVDSADTADSVPPTDSGTTPACADPDPQPAPTADGHPTDGWRWAPQGPLFPDRPGVAPYDGDLAPTLVDTGQGLHLLYNRQEGTTQTLWATTSTDGVAWTEPVAVTGLGDDVAYPSLAYRDGTFHLYYGSGSVSYATSTDGVDFVPGDTVLRTSDAGAFASLSLLYADAVVADAGGGEVWFAGFAGARFAIGVAEAAALGAPAEGGTLEIERDPGGWDNTSVAMPEVVDHGGARHIWYGGYDTVIANPGPWRIGTFDLTTGDRRVSLPLGEEGVDAWSTRDPAVVPWGDGWLMVYIGMGDDAIYRLLSATSDVCP